MRTAFSIAIYLYEPSDGGLDRVAILLANSLLQRGIAVELWMARREGALESLIDPALPVRIIAAPEWERGLAMAAQLPALRQAVRRHRPDILYSAGNQSNLLVALAALGTETAAVGRISNPIVRPGSRGSAAWLREKRFRATASLSAMTIVMGVADLQKLSGKSANRHVVHLPRPTVTPEIEAAAAARAPRDGQHGWRFAMIGRLSPQKDQRIALAALARLDDIDWRLKIAGKGPLRTELEKQCEELGIADRVDFLGFVDDTHELARLLGESDIVLLPSRWEGLAGAVPEAIGSGAQVVATDSTPNIHPLLAAAKQHEPTPPGDVDAFERAIRWTMANPAPGDLLEAAATPYRLETAVDAHIEAFARLVASRQQESDTRP